VNILLIQLKRIGDLILTTPAIRALREKFPDGKIILIASRECSALLPVVVGIDRSFLISRKLRDLATFVEVARTKFDCCVDFTGNDRSALLTFFSGARKRVAADRIREQSKIRARVYNQFVEHRLSDMHTLDFNLALLEPLGIVDASSELRLELPAGAREKADALRRAAQIDNGSPPQAGRRATWMGKPARVDEPGGKSINPFIVCHPGSARAEKFWQAERWAAVIDHAQTKWHLNVLITGGNWNFEQEHIREIKSKLRQPVIDLSGKTDLLTLTALIAQARLLLTVDSAPMHFAAATQTPQVVLFGPTNPFHWRPRESRVLILQGESKVPLTEFPPRQPRLPMNQISTEAVIDAMNELLSSPAEQAL
jgi:ADP-heptose:LPS heptosyltransferase